MIHLKYECKVNFVKLPLIWIYRCLKLIFENATAGRNTIPEAPDLNLNTVALNETFVFPLTEGTGQDKILACTLSDQILK